MRYRLPCGNVIRAENAAKPFAQRSKYLISILETLSPVENSFDYGSGKLRYLPTIKKTTDFLCVVDSEIQLSRTQKLLGTRQSVKSYLNPNNAITAVNSKEFIEFGPIFDRGFCINVLSAVPFPAVRKAIISRCFNALAVDGECIFVVQYRNSDFNRMLKMENARYWRGGILTDSLRGFSYYGLIEPEKLISLISLAGFHIDREIMLDGSLCLICRK